MSHTEGYVYCQNEQKTLGLNRDGCFAEYMIADSRSAFAIPDGLAFIDVAPLMCAGVLLFLLDLELIYKVSIYKALKRCNLRTGETVGIIGCGGGLGITFKFP